MQADPRVPTKNSSFQPLGEIGEGFILLMDDEPLLLKALRRILEADGYRVKLASDLTELEPYLSDPDLAVMLLDLFMKETRGVDVLERVKHERPEVEVIMMTGYATVESAVSCMQRGAFDYLAKPFDDVHRVNTTVQKALERRKLVTRNRQLEQELRNRPGDSDMGLIGNSPPMRKLIRTIQSLRNNESQVLIQGESGTGKELVAKAIHGLSARTGKIFVPVDCGALPESIIESELFGHQRGAYTGAVGAPGLFRAADGGTLFLDEIGEIPLAVQAKLLRSLQNKEVRPVGSGEALPVDIRVVSATHRDLSDMVSQGQFRMDLFYRLNVVRVEIPPLRDRKEDIPLLIQSFLNGHQAKGSVVQSVSDDALGHLLQHDWPGNVRELENVIESAVALTQKEFLDPSDFPFGRKAARVNSAPLADVELSLASYERCALEKALQNAAGDVREAARQLGIGRSTFYRKLARHGIES
jgi:two-component system response regulator HydG